MPQLRRHDLLDIDPLRVGGAREQGALVAVGDRGRVGQAGAHRQHLVAQRGRVQRDIARHFRARADQAHRAGEHVQQLRQFVELGCPQDAAGARDARVGPDGELRAERRRVRAHAAELVDAKQHAVAPDALLPEEHRPARIELDPQRDAEQQRHEQQQPGAGANQVEQALGHRSHPARRVNAARAAPHRPHAARRRRSCGGTPAG